MADPVAIVSVVSGAAVAIGVPFINSRLERSRLEQQSRDARLGELRVLLDGAVQHLYDAWTTLFEIEQEAQQKLPRPEPSNDFLRRSGRRLTEQTDLVVQDGLRVRLRTPPGAAIAAVHQAAQDSIAGYERDYRRFLESERFEEETPPLPPPVDLSQATGSFIDEVRRFAGVVSGKPALRDGKKLLRRPS